MSDFRNKLPLIFAVLFGIAIFYFGITKLIELSGPMRWGALLFIVCYITWLFAESKVALTESDKGKTSADKGTCEAYAAGRALTVLAALAYPTLWKEAGPWMPIGLMVFVSGVFFRLIAIRTLGQFYSHRVRVMGDHQVVSNGPYRLVRHPAYTGMLIAHLGVVIFFFNWYTLLMWLGILLPSMILRIRIEEKALFELKGYPEFAATRKRLIPGVW
ncbi:MAG TPA: isoprenylcysteine carboxylmethyltransferase family protein [Pseudomonadales bacterium]|nr:isoprenylcysteine carboxylmethyltransferase family protein [Pseudomonadales bacterium]